MSRIPDTEVDRLKRDVPVRQLAEAHGVILKAHGKDLIGLCVFHKDREPSMVVSPDKNLWHCLGACQTGGSSIDFVMRAEGLTFREAVKRLQAAFPLAAVAAPEPSPDSAVLDETLDDAALLDQVVTHYHEALKRSPEAMGYLKTRGLDHPEAIDHFRLGFAGTLGSVLPSRENGGDTLRNRLQTLGILRESGHEHLKSCLVVPIIDETARVTELYGRKIGSAYHADAPVHLYLKGPHRGVWNASGLEGAKEIILCEALLDALTFWLAGQRHVTASYGVEGFTADHLAFFKRQRVERLLIAYDADEAGDKAASSLARKLMPEGLDCYRVVFPKGMDANAYAQKVKPPEKSLDLVLKRAVWMGKPEGPSAREAAAAPLVAEVATAAKEKAAFPPPPVAPTAPPSNVEIDDRGEEVTLKIGPRRYRVRGLGAQTSHEHLRINLLIGEGDRYFLDTLDLYSARQRLCFVKQANDELGIEVPILKQDFSVLLERVERLLEERAAAKAAPAVPSIITVTERDRDAALALLKDPKLVERITQDLERCGLVGEPTNKLVLYLAALSRKLDAPLAVVVQSTSAAGKSSLMDAVLNLVPKEDRVQYSAMTGQSLFYMDPTALKHKVLAIAEEEGARNASYALKLLQSDGEVSIASTGKDPVTGKLLTQEYRVEGPVALLLTTTAIDLDEELLNRCLVLTVDEDRDQTRAIHRVQRKRETLEGLLFQKSRERLIFLHHNAQRLLAPLLVVNPFAEQLTFLDARTRARRDHAKYLTLIKTIALLHQHQRPIKTVTHEDEVLRYIEVVPEDIALANRLAREVLGRSLDELPPQARRLLGLLDALVLDGARRLGVSRSEVRFSRRDVREKTGWGNTQLKLHLGRLCDHEFLIAHRGKGTGFAYELAYEAKLASDPALPGLLDAESLSSPERSGFSSERSGVLGERSGGGRPPVGPRSAPGRGYENSSNPALEATLHPVALNGAENARGGVPSLTASVLPACATH